MRELSFVVLSIVFYVMVVLQLVPPGVPIASQSDHQYQEKVLGVSDHADGLSSSKTDAFVLRINQERVSNDKPTLKITNELSKIAQIRADDMKDNTYFSHTSPFGLTFMDYVSISEQDNTRFYCENLNMGTGRIHTAIEAWSRSNEHKKCMNDPRVKNIGYAYVQIDDVVYGESLLPTNIVVAIFGE